MNKGENQRTTQLWKPKPGLSAPLGAGHPGAGKSWAGESACGQGLTWALTVLLRTRGEKSHRVPSWYWTGYHQSRDLSSLPSRENMPLYCSGLALVSVGLGALWGQNSRYCVPGVWSGEREADGWLGTRMGSLQPAALSSSQLCLLMSCSGDASRRPIPDWMVPHRGPKPQILASDTD